MRKILIIAWKDIYVTYTDRTLIVLMLVTPLALATIIALAFGDIASGRTPLRDIPVAIVNNDVGDSGGFNAGNILTGMLVPDARADDSGAGMSCESATGAANQTADITLLDLTDATVLNTRAEAIAGVDNGTYAAAILIPTNFSQRLNLADGSTGPVTIEVYGDRGRSISAAVIRSIVEGFTNQMLTGQVTIAATIDAMTARAQTNPAFGMRFAQAANSGSFNPDFGCAFAGLNSITIEQQTPSGKAVEFNPLVMFGAAQAAFFALFTASGGAANIIEERRNWTMQRLIVSPTPRLNILLGKLVGVFGMVLLQLTFLFIAFTVVASLLDGQPTFIWGTDFPSIAALLVVLSLSAAGVGMMAAAVSRTAEVANVIGSVVSIFMGVMGGAFFQLDAVPALQPLTRLSVVFWGSDGFSKLADGQGDVTTNIIFLTVIGIVLFAFSLTMFTRRKDI